MSWITQISRFRICQIKKRKGYRTNRDQYWNDTLYGTPAHFLREPSLQHKMRCMECWCSHVLRTYHYNPDRLWTDPLGQFHEHVDL